MAIFNGTPGDDVMNGTSLADEFYGGAGDDYIVLGRGADKAWGGAGADTFVFKRFDAEGLRDVLYGFDVAEDTMAFSGFIGGIVIDDITATTSGVFIDYRNQGNVGEIRLTGSEAEALSAANFDGQVTFAQAAQDYLDLFV